MSSQVFLRRHPAAAATARQTATAVTVPTALCRPVLHVTPSTPLARRHTTELRRPASTAATRRRRRSPSSCTR